MEQTGQYVPTVGGWGWGWASEKSMARQEKDLFVLEEITLTTP